MSPNFSSYTTFDNNSSELCKELGITHNTIIRYASPSRELREDAHRFIVYFYD